MIAQADHSRPPPPPTPADAAGELNDLISDRNRDRMAALLAGADQMRDQLLASIAAANRKTSAKRRTRKNPA